MAELKERMAKVDIAVTFLLMFSVILLMGGLFWIIVYGPWSGNQDPNNKDSTNGKVELEIPHENEPESIEEALFEISDSNCTIVSYEIDFRDRKYEYISYQEFKNKALENKVVILSHNDSNESVLIIVEKSQIWIWNPKSS